jgi:hypothetical protein
VTTVKTAVSNLGDGGPKLLSEFLVRYVEEEVVDLCHQAVDPLDMIAEQ